MSVKQLLKKTKYYQMRKINKIKEQRLEKEIKLLQDEKISSFKFCYAKKNKILQITEMLDKIDIKIRRNVRFQSWIDVGMCFVNLNSVIDNLSPDYDWIVNKSLSDLEKMNIDVSNNVCRQNQKLIQILKKYIEKICKTIDKEILCCNEESKVLLTNTKKYYKNMLDRPAVSLEEAFQRILLIDDLCWQTGHQLMGLGRLDRVLQNVIIPDSQTECINIICDFYNAIHRYYSFKSSTVSLGDTGQIIVLGGVTQGKGYFCNKLTYAFIEAMKEYPIPDPKLLLRVSENMPEDLLKLAVECIGTGVGSPLLSNDDIVIPALIHYGYQREDAENYVTSACWEPLVCGHSSEKNNLFDLNYAAVIGLMYMNKKFVFCQSFEEVVMLYEEVLRKELERVRYYLDRIIWEKDPIITLLTPDCIKTKRDVANGGAFYNGYGFLTVGMANAVNSLLNIKRFVYEEKIMSLEDLKNAAVSDYVGYDDIYNILNKAPKLFGTESKEAVQLVERLEKNVEDYFMKYKNSFGGSVKWGLSSSNYQELGKSTCATLDGRKKNLPLSVHISAPAGVPYTELISFASKLNYDGQRANGNVVDFIVTPSLINNSIEKFVTFIKVSIKLGFFQMQINVVDSETLIDAKKHPEKHMNLIVRVWGFSAYFVDLPEAYQDVLINRSLQSETAYLV